VPIRLFDRLAEGRGQLVKTNADIVARGLRVCPRSG
jgi:hypothetical protein